MKREELLHYFDTSMGTETPAYALLGDGIESLEEQFNPEEETKQWINQANGNTTVKSYTPSLDVSKEDCVDDAMQACIDKLVDTLPTGKSAESYYVRFRLKDVTETAGTYTAYRRKCAVSVTSTGGDAGSNVMNAIKIGGKGEAEKGTFNVSTNTFTLDAAA